MGKLKNIIFIVGLSLGLGLSSVSCSSNDTQEDTRATALIQEADLIRSSISRGYLLQSSSRRDKVGIETLLVKIQTALRAISNNPNDQTAYQNLRIYLKELEGFQLLSEDRPQFQDFVSKAYSFGQEYASKAGLSLNGLGWLLFGYNFSAGTAPFYSYPENSWESGWTLDDSWIKMSNTSASAVLLSPSFNLSQVKDPAFRFSHLFLANKSSSNSASDKFDREQYLREGFTVHVSATYKAGEDPFESLEGGSLGAGSKLDDPKNKWQWQQVDLGPLPFSFDFASLETPMIDLGPYRSENVTIAFYFNNRGLGNHYTIWQIDRFELVGSSEGNSSFEYELPPESLIYNDFTGNSMGDFQVFTVNPDGSKWMSGAGGGNDYAVAKPFGRDSETWLLSPIYVLGNQTDLQLNVGEIVNTPIWQNFRLRISTDYKGGDPRSATWTEIEHSKEVRNNSWESINTSVNLMPYQGQEIVIAFQYVDPGGPGNNERVWEIDWLNIKGNGEPIEMKFYKAFASEGSAQ